MPPNHRCSEKTKLLGFSLIFALLASTALAKDGAQVNYAGDGRYTCSGNSAACAQVDANNRQRESQRQAEYQRDQERAQSIVDRERRKDEERRTNK
jgi:hypothetical protein